jgi:2-polyprenyl-3-methyl-5-hydroxy-6-metoxy-1,4-benzoquinol methylase
MTNKKDESIMNKKYRKQNEYFKRAYLDGEYPWPKEKATPGVVTFINRLIRKKVRGKMLDIGCGEGRHSILFADNGFKVTAIDIERIALNNAREKARIAGLSKNICFLKANVFSLPFSSGEFDVVLDYGVFHHLHRVDWEKYLSSIVGILKPNGYFIISVFGRRFKTYSGEMRIRNWIIREHVFSRFFSVQEIKSIFLPFFKILDIQERKGSKHFIHALMQRNF